MFFVVGRFSHGKDPYRNSTLVLYFRDLQAANATGNGKFDVRSTHKHILLCWIESPLRSGVPHVMGP